MIALFAQTSSQPLIDGQHGVILVHFPWIGHAARRCRVC
jgi:hypothetical protein